MKISLAKESQFNRLGLPMQDFSSNVKIYGTAWVRCARVKILVGTDQVGSWSDSAAKLRKITLEPGETIVLVPTGSAAIASASPVELFTETIQVAPDITTLSSLPVSTPNELKDGCCMFQRGTPEYNRPYTGPFLFRTGSMLWNLANTMYANTTNLTIVTPNIVMPGQGMTGPRESNTAGVENTSDSINDVFWNNTANAIKGVALTANNTAMPRPVFVNHYVRSMSTLIGQNWLVALGEITCAPANMFTGFNTGQLYSQVVKCFFTVLESPVIIAAQQPVFNLIYWFPKWRPAVGNRLVAWIAPDYAIGTNSCGVNSGYACPQFIPRNGPGGIVYTQIGVPTAQIAANIQPV